MRRLIVRSNNGKLDVDDNRLVEPKCLACDPRAQIRCVYYCSLGTRALPTTVSVRTCAPLVFARTLRSLVRSPMSHTAHVLLPTTPQRLIVSQGNINEAPWRDKLKLL